MVEDSKGNLENSSLDEQYLKEDVGGEMVFCLSNYQRDVLKVSISL